MIFSLWDDVEVNMLWLDSAFPLDKPVTDPGIKRGDCPGGQTSTPPYLRETYPNGGVIFKNAAVGEIGSTYDSPAPLPTARPTEPTGSEGCFSNNYKDCLPDTYSNEPSSCNTVWLPNGSQQNCIALWDDCTGQGNGSCCGNAVCFGDDSHSACVPPTDSTETPTQKPTTQEPTPPACIICDDQENAWQIKKGFDCATDTVRMNKKCNKDDKWIAKKWCRLSCYKAGNGYPGDVCCDDSLSNRKNLRTR